MEQRLRFCGADQRMLWAKAYLLERGYVITEDSPTHLILSMPARMPEVELLLPGITVLGGGMSEIRSELAEAGANIVDLMEDEALTARNAEITAEGALEVAMAALPVTLSGCRVLVSGWGRIGQLLAHKLKALGAQVTVSSRRPRELALADALGYSTLPTGFWGYLGTYRLIFNTVPAPVFSEVQLAATRADCVLVELASSPGGFAPDIRPVLQARGLPGKTAPETAGLAYGQAVERYLRKEAGK